MVPETLAPTPADSTDIVILKFPTKPGGRDGPTVWALRRSKLDEYRESFPGLDVLTCCRNAVQWCRDNADKRKTARGMPRFLTNWLTTDNNSGKNLRPQARKTIIPKLGTANDD